MSSTAVFLLLRVGRQRRLRRDQALGTREKLVEDPTLTTLKGVRFAAKPPKGKGEARRGRPWPWPWTRRLLWWSPGTPRSKRHRKISEPR